MWKIKITVVHKNIQTTEYDAITDIFGKWSLVTYLIFITVFINP